MILYEGPSSFDGAPVVVIATGYERQSKNPKTGSMIQTWIIRSDINPFEAVKSGKDSSVCLTCPQRWHNGGGCYVNPAYAPLNVYKRYKRGKYQKVQDIAAFGEGKNIRLGSYGDPAVIPLDVWENLISKAAMYTGYTHAWRSMRGKGWKNIFMASVERPHDVVVANMLGWRTFRTGEKRKTNEMTCPASAEAGKKLTCLECNSCDGTNASGLTIKNIVIKTHGTKANKAMLASPVEDLFMPYLS